MAEALQISRSGYYAGRKRPISRREEENQTLVKKIAVVHQANRQVYGSPRVTEELKAQGSLAARPHLAQTNSAYYIELVITVSHHQHLSSGDVYALHTDSHCHPHPSDLSHNRINSY